MANQLLTARHQHCDIGGWRMIRIAPHD